jgi:hypothetical protein
MPSTTSKHLPKRPDASARKAVPPPTAPKTGDVRTDARQARTREYMRDENKREAALAAKGYWF